MDILWGGGGGRVGWLLWGGGGGFFFPIQKNNKYSLYIESITRLHILMLLFYDEQKTG